MTFEPIVNEIFDTMRQLIRSNSKLYKSLDNNYKSGILFYFNMVPNEYREYITKAFAIFKEYLTCFDFHKFLTITSKFNMVSVNINSKDLIGTFIIESFNDMTVRRFVSEIVDRLDRIFICIDYALAHPKEILKNASVFDKIEDIF